MATALASLLVACDPGAPWTAGRVDAPALSAAQRQARAAQIRDAAFAAGITQGWLLAGIAQTETGMAHCYSEYSLRACMGPASPDCGGGPVLAGGADGPCDLMQGGLGMFQFDGGTYEQTLMRDGEAILTVDGNVQRAVEFVLNMVVRSTFIPGVSTRDEAIAWVNQVRIDDRIFVEQWIPTVVRYYNGCSTTASCWGPRNESYRTKTETVYSEMLAVNPGFWVVRPTYAAQFVTQSFPLASVPLVLAGGTELPGFIELRNTGTAAWQPGEVVLATTEPRDGPSPVAASDWLTPNRAATVDAPVAPGDIGRFTFSVRAPLTPADYPQFFTLRVEDGPWFSDDGGPPDDQLQVRVTAVEPPDVDGDGYTLDDCDPNELTIHPGALEICADGIDQDCDGVDALCPDAGTPAPPPDAGTPAASDAAPDTDGGGPASDARAPDTGRGAPDAATIGRFGRGGLTGGCSIAVPVNTPTGRAGQWRLVAIAAFLLALRGPRRRRALL